MRECLICFLRVNDDERKWAQTLMSCDCLVSNPNFHALCLLKSLAIVGKCPLCRLQVPTLKPSINTQSVHDEEEFEQEPPRRPYVMLLYGVTTITCLLLYMGIHTCTILDSGAKYWYGYWCRN